MFRLNTLNVSDVQIHNFELEQIKIAFFFYELNGGLRETSKNFLNFVM